MLRRNQRLQGVLAAIAAKVGFVPIEVIRRGSVEVTVYRGLGLKVQRSRVVHAEPEEDPVIDIDSLRNLARYLGESEAPRVFDAEFECVTADHAQETMAAVAGTVPAGSAAPPSQPALTGRRNLGMEFVDFEPAAACEPETAAETTAITRSARYPIFAGKTVAVIGFPEAEAEAIGMALAVQQCSFLLLSQSEAEFRKGALNGCDLLIIWAPAEWAAPETLESGMLLKTKKPAVVIGPRDAVEAAGMWTQGGPREFMPEPWSVDDAVWRASLLFGRSPAPKQRRGRRSRMRRVVIGDADDAMRSLVAAVLGQEEMECFAADNGASLMSLARSKQADAVIVDVSLPALDGFQVLANIRRDPDLQGAAVILLTARQAEADVLRGFGLGADDYITKPFSPMELTARLKRCLGRRS